MGANSFGKLTGNGLLSINQNPLTYPIFSDSSFSRGGVPPFEGDWREWNGSSSPAIQAVGDTYDFISNVYKTPISINIDATRFLLISEGYYDFNTSTYFPLLCRVGVIENGDITYEAPIELEASILPDSTTDSCVGVQISDGKVAVALRYYDIGGTYYYRAVIILIDGSNTITFGSANSLVIPSGALISSIALFDATHLALLYTSDLGGFIETLTIFPDNSLVENDPTNVVGTSFIQFSVMLCLDAETILLLYNQHAYIVPITDSITVGSPIFDLTIATYYSNYGLISGAKLSATQAMVITDNVTDDFYSKVEASILTWNGTALSQGAINNIFTPTNTSESHWPLAAFATNNVGNQVISVCGKTNDGQHINALAICLTPNGNTVLAGTLYPINANNYNFSSGNYYFTQGCILNNDAIVMPWGSYNGGINYGASLVARANVYATPTFIADWEADTNLFANKTVSLATVTGTMGDDFFTAVGVDLRATLLPGTRIYVTELIVPFTFYVVDVTYDLMSSTSTITVTVNLSTNFGASNLQIDEVVDWTDKIGGYKLSQVSSLTASTGVVNNQPTIIFYSATANANLVSDPIDIPMTIDATMFLVAEVRNAGLSATANVNSTEAANLTGLADVQRTFVDIYPNGFGTTEQVSGFNMRSSGLQLLTLVRRNKNTQVYINGVLIGSNLNTILGIGNPLTLKLGNNLDNSNPLVGYVSAISMAWGILSDAEIIEKNNYYIDKYNLA